jgi:hypothetical protein
LVSSTRFICRILRIPTHRDHPFRLIVTADSGGT